MTSQEFDINPRDFFATAIILSLLSVLGTVGNLAIIVATARSRSLRGPCNIFIALLALDDIGHQSSHFIYAYFVFSGTPIVDLRLCFWLMAIPSILMLHSIGIMLVIGLDRLCCVLFPLTYKASYQTYAVPYIILANVFPIAYTILTALEAFSELHYYPMDSTEFCIIPTFFVGKSAFYWTTSTVVINLLTVLTYCLIWILVWIRTAVTTSTKNSLIPLTIILFLSTVGWLFGMCTGFIIQLLGVSGNHYLVITPYAGLTINIAIAANYLVYRFFSVEYKSALINAHRFSTRKGTVKSISVRQLSSIM